MDLEKLCGSLYAIYFLQFILEPFKVDINVYLNYSDYHTKLFIDFYLHSIALYSHPFP